MASAMRCAAFGPTLGRQRSEIPVECEPRVRGSRILWHDRRDVVARKPVLGRVHFAIDVDVDSADASLAERPASELKPIADDGFGSRGVERTDDAGWKVRERNGGRSPRVNASRLMERIELEPGQCGDDGQHHQHHPAGTAVLITDREWLEFHERKVAYAVKSGVRGL